MNVRRLFQRYILMPVGNNDPFLLVDRDSSEVLACSEWYLSASLQPLFYLYYDSTLNPRWEFFTTLDYEWRVIRGRSPYRWTIWVRNDQRFPFAFFSRRSPGLICSIDRFTP